MRIVMPMGVDVRSAPRRGWDKGGMQKISKEGRGGEKIRINTLTERWHNFASSAQEDVTGSGAGLWSAAVLTHKPLGDVGGGCASHLSLQATKPGGNASLSIFLPRERWTVSTLRVWYFSSSQQCRSCQGNLSSLSPSGLLLVSSGWG